MPRMDPGDERNEGVSRQPLERDKNGHRILTHGLKGYVRGCRCDVCRAAKKANRQSPSGNRILTHGLSGYARGCRCDICMARGGENAITHGNSGYAQGCRCDICTAGRAEYRERKRGYPAATLDPEDERTIPETVQLSPRVSALIEDEAGDSAIGWWIWTAITEKLERDVGYVDQVRRQAPRRANRRQRGEGQES